MEERYEIRGKIGQGGLGAVYKAYDTRMNREVAIKRISVNAEDPSLQEESTKQLIKEAGALSSLQHPHIVTVYDVGQDEYGPYVVMELLSGKTLDETIERAPLTWSDFKQLAMQTQEALIAAHELNLIHGDIKPSNLMFTWLASGKFQMKVVDFGLAVLAQSQSHEEMQELEAVFGSIFFMAPEQFERMPLDFRTDIYAMGCVYYQALAGTYPFKGETGNEVMEAHLQHRVVPLQEVRSDIPLWACDWVMWQINRLPADRPASARESLQVFLQNDKTAAPTMSLGRATPLAQRPRINIPGAMQAAAPTRPIIDPRMAPPGYVPPEPPVPEVIPDPPRTASAPQQLQPPEGYKPSLHIPDVIPDATATARAYPTGPLHPTGQLHPTGRILPTRPLNLPVQKKSGLWMKLAIGALALAILAAVGVLLKNRIDASKGSQRYSNLVEDAVKPEVQELPVSAAEYNRLLLDAANADIDEKRKAFFQALQKATPNDGSDFDSATSNFLITTDAILPETRVAMIREVLTKRVNRSTVPPLVDFARRLRDLESAVAIYDVVRPLAGETEFEAFLSLTQFGENPAVKKAAEENAIAIIKRSNNRQSLVSQVETALQATSDGAIKDALQRIKTAGGG